MSIFADAPAQSIGGGESFQIASNSFSDQAEKYTRFQTDTRDLDALFQADSLQSKRPGERAALLGEMFNSEKAGGLDSGTVAGILGRTTGESNQMREWNAESLDLLHQRGMLDVEMLTQPEPGRQAAMDVRRGENPITVNQRIGELVRSTGNEGLKADYHDALLTDLNNRAQGITHADRGTRRENRDVYDTVLANSLSALDEGNNKPALDTLRTLWQNPQLRSDFVNQATDKEGLTKLINADYQSMDAPDLTESVFQDLVKLNPNDQASQDGIRQYFSDNIGRITSEATDPGFGLGKEYPDGSPMAINNPEIARANESDDHRLVRDYVGNVLLNDGLNAEQVKDRFSDIRGHVDSLTDKANDRDLPMADRKKAARELNTTLRGLADGIEDAVVRAKNDNDRSALSKLTNSVGTVTSLFGPKGAAAGAGLIVLSNYINSPNVSERLQKDFVNSAITGLNEPHGANYEADSAIRDIVQNGNL